jgi:hypothetical protein
MKIPSAQTFGIQADGWTSFPEGPCRISNVIVFPSLT